MNKYPKDYKVMSILFSCKNNLNKEEYDELLKYVLGLKAISPKYLRSFISIKFDPNKFRFNTNVNEDIYIYNYVMYGDDLKNNDLFKCYYDLYLRNIRNIMLLLDVNN